MSGLAAAAAAVGKIGEGILNYTTTRESNHDQYIYNKALAEQAFERNMKAWSLENAYNSPAAQMQRMRAAGLNPNLIYGNGQEASAGLAGDAPELNYASYNPKVPVFGDAVGAGINAALQAKQINALVAQADATVDKTNAETQTLLKNYEWIDKEKEAAINKQVAETITQEYLQGNYQALTDQATENCRKLHIETETLWKQFRYIDKSMKLAQDLTAAEINEINERTKDYPVLRAKLAVEMKTLLAQAVYLASAANLNDQEAMAAGQRMYESMTRIDNIIADTGLKGRQADALKGAVARQWISTISGSVRDLAVSYSAIMGMPQINLSSGQSVPGGYRSLYPSMENNPWMVEY